ncbi:MAG: hypothetical protein NXI32_12885, partial [bacterium]|nr:hypothetical protein [bacterium]
GGQSIFWSGGLTPQGDVQMETVQETQDGNMSVLAERKVGSFVGQGSFNLDFLLYALAGFDLSIVSKATLETLRLPPRVLTPFLVFIVVSLMTRRGSQHVLDRYYAKMKTEVDPDPEIDRRKLEAAYANPSMYADKRLFPGTDWEFLKPRSIDIAGFVISVIVCGLMIGLLVFLAGIGS